MKKVLIYGYSGAGKLAHYSLDQTEYEVVGYIDDKTEIQGSTLWGNYPVVGSERISEFDYDFIIVAPFWRSKEILGRLNGLHVPKEKIILWDEVHGVSKLDYRIAQLRLCIDEIYERNIEGSCAEVGVYKGEFAKYINRFLYDRKLYLFDTFEGFGDQGLAGREIDGLSERLINEFQDTSIDEVMRKMPNPDRIEIRKGLFPDTAKEISDDERFAFVSLDCDLYNPILEGLKFFYPRLSPGGYIFVHDAGGYLWPGAKQAVDEFCDEYGAVKLPILDKCLSTIISK